MKANFSKANLNLCMLLLPVLFSFTFMLLNVDIASATHIMNASLENGTQRIVPAGDGLSAILTLIVNNTAGSTHVINGTNITNGTATAGYYKITAVTPPNSGWTCTIEATRASCSNSSTAGVIAVGSYATFTITTTVPATGSTGVQKWSINTSDANLGTYSIEAPLLAIGNGDIGFDIRDELGNVLTGANVTLTDPGAGLSGNIVVNNITDGSGFDDAAADGLVIFDRGDEISGVAGDTVYNYTISVANVGFVTKYKTGDKVSYYSTSPRNGNRDDLQYYIKVTVWDELSNALTGAVVNITNATSGAGGSGNSTITPNATFSNAYYFALNIISFSNVTFMVNRTGFISNVTSTTFLVNNTTQQGGLSPYLLNYSVKLTVRNELQGIANMDSDVTIAINKTDKTPDKQVGNVYYYNLTRTDYDYANISANKTGYINTTSINFLVNTSTSAILNLSLPFSMKVGVITEATTGLQASSAAYMVNNTTVVTPTNTSGGYAYFVRDAGLNATQVNVSYPGYVHNYSMAFLINQSAQAYQNITMPYTIKVIDIRDELNNTLFTINGNDAFVEVIGNTTTYSGGAAYIPTKGGLGVTVVAGRNSYVNTTKLITANGSSQTLVVFNQSGSPGAVNATGGLPFTVRVRGVWNELGNLSFIVDGATDVGIAYNESGNVTYSGGNAYVNITGAAEKNITAFTVCKNSFVNQTLNITPSGAAQKTVLFNLTNTIGATVLGGGLKYPLKINVTDELSGIANMNSNVVVILNGTVYAANATVGTVSYFRNETAPLSTFVNITVSRDGYVNMTANLTRLNTSQQSFKTLQLPFALRVNVTNELQGIAGMDSGVTIAFNGTTATANSTNATQYYYAFTKQDFNLTIIKSGYVNKTSNQILLNATNQSLQSLGMNFTIKVVDIRDELNNTNFTIDGTESFAEVSGIRTNYSACGPNYGGCAFIPAPAGSVSVVAGRNGYVNTTKTVTFNETLQTLIVFNESGSPGAQNATGLDFAVKVMGLCDELNKTCPTLNGSADMAGFGGASSFGNTSNYSAGVAYIPANSSGTGNANITAFALGYVNASQLVALTPGSAQAVVYFNGTYPLRFPLKLTMQDELGNSTNMNISEFAVNNTWKSENKDYWRSASTSNVYYFNISVAAYNVTAGRAGYINASSNNTAFNATLQGLRTIKLPFSVKVMVRTVTLDNQSLNGSQLTIKDGSSTVATIIDGSSNDGDTTANGIIYYPLNKTATPSVAEFSVLVGNNPFTGSITNWTAADGAHGYTLNDSTQTAVIIYTDAPRPFNFTTYYLTSNTWQEFRIAPQSLLETKLYSSTSTSGWNISTVMSTIGLGTTYDTIYYSVNDSSTGWKVFIRTDWAGSSLQYINNTNNKPYYINTTTSTWFIM